MPKNDMKIKKTRMTKKGRSIFKQGVSLFTLILFLSTNLAYATPAHAASPKKITPATRLPSAVSDIEIPEGLGSIQTYHQSTGGQTVIIVQDAHAIPDAQRSIRKLIEYFQEAYGINLVNVEGAATRLDPQIFRSFPDKKILQAVFDEYMEKGELTGSAAAAIFNETEAQFRGVEDWDLYEEGLYYFLLSAEQESELLKELETRSMKLEEQKKQTYSKELLEIDRLLEDFYENSSALVKVLQKLSEIKEPAKDTELAALLEESKRNGLDATNVAIEVRKLAESVKRHLKSMPTSQASKEDWLRFNSQYQAFQTSRLTAHAFALFLKEEIFKGNLPIKVSDHLFVLMKDQKTIKEIEGTELFDNFEAHAKEIKENLIKSPEEKELDRQTEIVRLTRKLIKLELNIDDWKKVSESEAAIGRMISADKLIPHFSFYKNAENRDRIFADRIIAHMREERVNQSVFIGGGFHSHGLMKELKAKGVSSILIMPEISHPPDHSAYREHMQGKVPWGSYYLVENGKIDLRGAFIRGTRDRLIKRHSETRGRRISEQHLLKRWRDQIIRDLSAKDKITNTSQYFPFIDEIRKSGNAQLDRLARVDQFIDGLETLKVQDRVNPQNIMALLHAATLLEMTSSTTGLAASELRMNLFTFQNGVFQPARPEVRAIKDWLPR